MITTDELKNLPYLQQEIDWNRKRIEQLKNPQRLKGIPPAHVQGYAAVLTEDIELCQEQIQRCTAQLEKLRDFVNGINDPFTRELFRLRYECGKEWATVFDIMYEKGYHYADEGSLRKICGRYLKRYNDADERTRQKCVL